MTTLLRIEKALCTLYVALTYPFIAMGNVWMQRIEGMEKPEEPQNDTDDCVLHPHKTWESSPREPTVSDIQPRGMVKVHAMDETGKWQQLHDYPVRLLSKVPGIEIRGGEKQ